MGGKGEGRYPPPSLLLWKKGQKKMLIIFPTLIKTLFFLFLIAFLATGLKCLLWPNLEKNRFLQMLFLHRKLNIFVVCQAFSVTIFASTYLKIKNKTLEYITLKKIFLFYYKLLKEESICILILKDLRFIIAW